MKYLFSILCVIILPLLSYAQQYEIVVATDFDGKVVDGSIDALIAEIRKGKPVRVGWQLDFNKDKKPDFDHWVEATFITVLEGHVFTQIDPIFAQGPNAQAPQIEIFESPAQWTAVIGTNGKLLNRFIPNTPTTKSISDADNVDPSKPQSIKKVPIWKVATFWAVPK